MMRKRLPDDTGQRLTASATIGRPQRADSRRNRASVLQAAQEAFASDGLAVPIDEIARRAGVGPGTVYRHFSTKEALFEAVVLRRIRDLIEQADRVADAPDPEGALFDFIAQLLTAGVAKKDLVDALAGAGVDVSAMTAGGTKELQEKVDRLLSRAQQAGRVRKDISGADLMVLVSSLLIAGQRNQGDAELPYRLLAVFRAGLCAAASSSTEGSSIRLPL